MKLNMGSLDRILRVVVAAALAYAYATGQIAGPWGIAAVVVAVVFAATAFVGVCPLYLPFGISTRKKQTDR